MDPFTLFALANGAVTAVKQGCKLYKDIKGAAGEVKDILKDLDSQFHKMYEGKPVPAAAREQLQQEKARVIELNKKDPSDVYSEIGEQLGTYFENMAKCIAIFDEEERKSQEVYTGEESVGKRALKRVLMRKKLEAMGVELRELLVYQSPPELGALYTEVFEMMEKINKEQTIAIQRQMREEETRRRRRKQIIEHYWVEGLAILGLVLALGVFVVSMIWVVETRKEMYPHLGDGWIPKTEEQRRREAEPKKYIGR